MVKTVISMDVSTINWPETITVALMILGSVGGVIGKKYLGKALGGVSAIADMLTEFSELLVLISKAGEDENLTTEEWTKIKTQAKELNRCMTLIKGKFGETFKV